MGCICGCHEKLEEVGVNGCCWKCEAEHDTLRNALLQVQELQKNLPCGHPAGCLEDDQCGLPEHRFCGWCNEIEFVRSQGERATKAETELNESNRLLDELRKDLAGLRLDSEGQNGCWLLADSITWNRIRDFAEKRIDLPTLKQEEIDGVKRCLVCGGSAHSGACRPFGS